jgi:hypothetical protein
MALPVDSVFSNVDSALLKRRSIDFSHLLIRFLNPSSDGQRFCYSSFNDLQAMLQHFSTPSPLSDCFAKAIHHVSTGFVSWKK